MARVSLGKNSGFIIKDIGSTRYSRPGYQQIRESEAYAAFLSDLHIGSKYFMEDEFTEFVDWISSPDPIAKKIRFVLIGGDVVDGVGIYPNQNKELVCQTIEEQLDKVNSYWIKFQKMSKS